MADQVVRDPAQTIAPALHQDALILIVNHLCRTKWSVPTDRHGVKGISDGGEAEVAMVLAHLLGRVVPKVVVPKVGPVPIPIGCSIASMRMAMINSVATSL